MKETKFNYLAANAFIGVGLSSVDGKGNCPITNCDLLSWSYAGGFIKSWGWRKYTNEVVGSSQAQLNAQNQIKWASDIMGGFTATKFKVNCQNSHSNMDSDEAVVTQYHQCHQTLTAKSVSSQYFQFVRVGATKIIVNADDIVTSSLPTLCPVTSCTL